MSNGGANGNGKAGGSSAAPLGGEPLFTEVCSTDVLGFSFGGRSYQDQLHEAVAKTKGFCGVDVALRTVAFAGKEVSCVWVAHNFAFLGACFQNAYMWVGFGRHRGHDDGRALTTDRPTNDRTPHRPFNGRRRVAGLRGGRAHHARL